MSGVGGVAGATRGGLFDRALGGQDRGYRMNAGQCVDRFLARQAQGFLGRALGGIDLD